MKFRKILLIFLLFVFIFLVLPFAFKIIIIRTLKSNERWDIKDIRLNFTGINLKDLTYRDTWIFVKMDNLKISPFLVKNVFAFEGPGEFISNFEKRKLKVKGRIRGNIKNGNLNITQTDINLNGIGNIKFNGTLHNWGKDRFDGNFYLYGVNVKEISEITEYKIPFDGEIYGNIFIEKEKEEVKEVRYSFEVRELKMENETSKFNLFLKGKYIPKEKTAIIEEGIFKNEKGEKITFNGFLTQNEFDFYFDTQEFSVDEFLKLLPEEIRKKYNIRIGTSKIIMDKFALKISKKKFLLMETFFSFSNIYPSIILN